MGIQLPPRGLTTHRAFGASVRDIVVALSAAAVTSTLSCVHAPVTWNQIAALPVRPPDHRIAYGPDSLMFGELRLPKGPGPFPVAVVIHGGCWRSEYDLHHITPLAAALTDRGIATWTVEYRRIGDDGGGWPGTFQDVGRGADFLRELAKQYPLDLRHVITIGHSAGGHLALWVAARAHLPAGSEVASADPLPIQGIVGLAAISDLATYARGVSSCMQSTPVLMGGSPDSLPERYAQASPIELLPLGVPVRLVHGAEDTIVPLDQSRAFVTRFKERGGDGDLIAVAHAGHFDLIAPAAPAFTQISAAAHALLWPGGDSGEYSR